MTVSRGMPTIHHGVLIEESMLALDVKPGGVYIDGTLGGGGHTEELLKRSAPNGRVVSFDVDAVALERARRRFAEYTDRWQGIEENFRYIARVAEVCGVSECDGILLDLGVSSDELADPTKGLSFREDGPLDMRLGERANEDGLTASDIVNSWSSDDLIRMLRVYGEERYAKRIADSIVQARRSARIVGTLDLAAIIRQAVPGSYEHGRIHPATRTFQALRIAVNDELEALREAISGCAKTLRIGGRIAVITFHSLEDRIVKHELRTSDWKPLEKKPIYPSEQELAENPRSRSAKLRSAERIQ